MNKKTLADRMKEYENVNRHYLTKKLPVIIRVDERAFHSFTSKLKKPFDMSLIYTIEAAAYNVAMDMQGFKLGYVQSDEASFVLTDYKDINTGCWF